MSRGSRKTIFWQISKNVYFLTDLVYIGLSILYYIKCCFPIAPNFQGNSLQYLAPFRPYYIKTRADSFSARKTHEAADCHSPGQPEMHGQNQHEHGRLKRRCGNSLI